MFIYNLKINGGLLLKIIIVVLSIFMLIVFVISVYRIFFTNNKFSVDDRIVADNITKIQPENYTNILQAVHDDLDSYVGVKIKFIGYVYRVIDFKENQFVLARDMLINEEQTQSVVVGFLSEYKDSNKFKDGEWVEVEGIIEKGKYHNKEIPLIKVLKMQQTSEPENSFVMPTSDTYIPIRGVV